MPGARIVSKPEASKLPDAFYEIGPAAVATIVGLLGLLSVLFLLRPPPARASVARSTRTSASSSARPRGPAEERFTTASSLMKATEKAFGHLRVWHALHRLLERADLPLKTVELVYAAVGAGLLAGLLFAAAGMSTLSSSPPWSAAVGLPILVVWHKAKRRLAAIDDQLPDLLVTLAATLKAGTASARASRPSSTRASRPRAKSSSACSPRRGSAARWTTRWPTWPRIGSKNVTFVVTAVTIQRQVGGSLAGIFDMVADAVRNRQQFARKIRSLTAMGRASAYVLVGVPFFMLGTITLLSPEYMDRSTSTGNKLMILGCVMITIGSLMLKKIVSFKG